jgi:hypothetical protein
MTEMPACDGSDTGPDLVESVVDELASDDFGPDNQEEDE